MNSFHNDLDSKYEWKQFEVTLKFAEEINKLLISVVRTSHIIIECLTNILWGKNLYNNSPYFYTRNMLSCNTINLTFYEVIIYLGSYKKPFPLDNF